MKIEISQVFASNSKANEFDVRQMKKALNRLGYYQPLEKTGITGIPDAAIFMALKSFQKDHGITATGTAKPNDATIHNLNEQTSKIPSGRYIWRTVGDNKVRKAHAELDGTMRDWSTSPYPGEEPNCRCWAESIENDEIHDPPIKPLYPELLIIPALRTRSILSLLGRSAARIIQSAAHSRVKMDDTRTWPKSPASGRLREGLPSRQKPRTRGEKSLYDERGGEWRYAKDDKYHNPHWDYKESPSSSWKNIPIDDKPILKGEE